MGFEVDLCMQPCGEVGYRSLKVDVVLPEGIVCVDEEDLFRKGSHDQHADLEIASFIWINYRTRGAGNVP